MRLSEFQYYLPEELIAQFPPDQRGDSRLLVVDRNSGQLQDYRFEHIHSLIRPGDLLVLNNTRVMPARLFGKKITGGKVEILIERLLDDHRALAHVRASKSPGPGTELDVDSSRIRVTGRRDNLFELESLEPGFKELMRTRGHIPLPGYIQRADSEFDTERYQTVYAQNPGAVAAPTAGLHFTRSMLDRLRDNGVEIGYVTLHVGAGTFQPVRVDNIDEHRMHEEWVEVDDALCVQIDRVRSAGGRIIAVGTTAVRSLETAAARTGKIRPFRGDTRLFITPGYDFRVIDGLITNFHLPESTLLMLTCAFGGYSEIMAAYRHAVEYRYRFFSYGDAMFIGDNPE